MLARQRRNMIDDGAGALLIGLHGKAEAAPIGERCVGQCEIDDGERKLEPVGLFRVDRELNIMPFREPARR